MARNFDAYDDDSESSDNNDSDDSNNFDDDEKTMLLTPYAELEVEFDEVFGTQTSWGSHALGVKMTDVELVDGCLYYDSEKDKYKVFSWEDVVGVSPGDEMFNADEASEFLVKTYGTTKKRYERVETVDPDNDDPVSIGDAIMWYGGSDDYGPKSASKVLAQLLTNAGRDMVLRDDGSNVNADVGNWLADTSTDNVLRDDLKGRRFAFFEIEKDSNESDRQFQHPVVEDVTTEKLMKVNTGDSSSQAEVDDTTEEAAATDGGVPAAETTEGVPEPINDFVQSVQQFDDFSEDRASTLLEDFVGDDDLPLTQDLVDDFGGEDAVLAEAGY